MKRFTSFLTMWLLSVSFMTGLAQTAIVGTYDGDLECTHLDNSFSSVPEQQLTIYTGENGIINMTFPSVDVLGRFTTGEITIEDITATEQENGTYSINKENFTISFSMGQMTTSYNYCTLSGTITTTGNAEVTLSLVQNPQMGAATTATFYGGVPDVVSPIVAAYGGELYIKQMTGTEETATDQIAVVSKETFSTANIKVPSFSIMGRFTTGDFTVEGVNVTAQEDGSYLLSKKPFTINAQIPGGMSSSYPNSTLTGTVSAEGAIQMTIEVIQNPSIPALTTVTFTGKPLDSSTFVWGQAAWNTEDGICYENIEDFQNAALTLTYPNPTGYNLTRLNILAMDCQIYVDEETSPIEYKASAQGSTSIPMSYQFAEGHSYRIVTVNTVLAQANLATFTTDTLSENNESYTISFSIKGPELQKTIEVEGYMSLSITNQNIPITASKLDVEDIKSTLGISNISEATIHALNPNGSYNDHMDYYDFWHDADGGFTNYNGGYDSYNGHNAYPAVYCIKINEAADSITYFFYDYWKVYDPEEGGTIPGFGSGSDTPGIKRATSPTTSYNSVIWDWDNGDGTITQYKRNYRVDEGKDYKADFMIVANGKSVLIHATLHFLSQEDYNKVTGIKENVADSNKTDAGSGKTEYYLLNGTRVNGLQKGINIVRKADGSVQKVIVK